MTGARGDLRGATETGRGGCLRGGTETGGVGADVAVVLLDREGQVLAGEQLLLRDQPVEALPVVGQDALTPDPDPVESAPAGTVIPPPPLPGQGSPCHRVKAPPEPNLVFFPSTHRPLAAIWALPL